MRRTNSRLESFECKPKFFENMVKHSLEETDLIKPRLTTLHCWLTGTEPGGWLQSRTRTLPSCISLKKISKSSEKNYVKVCTENLNPVCETKFLNPRMFNKSPSYFSIFSPSQQLKNFLMFKNFDVEIISISQTCVLFLRSQILSVAKFSSISSSLFTSTQKVSVPSKFPLSFIGPKNTNGSKLAKWAPRG